MWHTDVTALAADPDAVARTIASLPDADRARAAKYRVDRDRAMFLGGRVMARTLVGGALGLDRDGWQWREGERGRPEIGQPATALHFNLAHSAGLVVCALAHGRDVGVDVEDLAARRARSAAGAPLLLAGRSRGHRRAGRSLARSLPHLLDAEGGLPQGARPRHRRAARGGLLHP